MRHAPVVSRRPADEYELVPNEVRGDGVKGGNVVVLPARTPAAAPAPRSVPADARTAALEAENEGLRDENERLTGEVSKLRRALRHAANMIESINAQKAAPVGSRRCRAASGRRAMAATSANVRSRPGEALTASPVKGGAAQFGLHKKRYTDSGTRWQVVAFRAVRDGDLKVMRELAFEQPGLLHDRFTDAMEDWELEFESPKWYQFRDATCLFIACAYARREAVEFLLEFGADRDDKCYMSQRPIDVVGMCREDDMDESYITTILSRPKQPPRAPREPKTTCKLCLEELSHIERYDVPDPDGGAPQQKTRRVSETVARAPVGREVEDGGPALHGEGARRPPAGHALRVRGPRTERRGLRRPRAPDLRADAVRRVHTG